MFGTSGFEGPVVPLLPLPSSVSCFGCWDLGRGICRFPGVIAAGHWAAAAAVDLLAPLLQLVKVNSALNI